MPPQSVAFGFSTLVATALNREALGNWHLQFIAPAVCGMFMCAWVVSQGTRIRVGILASILILVGGIKGAGDAFFSHGPAFHAYVRSIERYILSFTPNASQPKPYPPQDPRWEVDQRLIDFLAKRHHALFAGAPS